MYEDQYAGRCPKRLEPDKLFSHRLALALGMTVGDIERRMSGSELISWRLFDAEWGLPDVVGDTQNALMCTVIANCNRSSNSPAFEIDEFRVLSEKDVVPKPQDLSSIPMTEAEKFKSVLGR